MTKCSVHGFEDCPLCRPGYEERRRRAIEVYKDGKVSILVGSCAECPFFGHSLASALFAAVKKREHIGECRCWTKTPEGTFAKAILPVEDSRTVPKWCPLHLGDVVVTLGS